MEGETPDPARQRHLEVQPRLQISLDPIVYGIFFSCLRDLEQTLSPWVKLVKGVSILDLEEGEVLCLWECFFISQIGPAMGSVGLVLPA